MDHESAESDLMRLLQKILMESGHHVKEMNHYRLQSVLRQKFGVKYTIKAIQKTLQGGRWIVTFGWGRGKDYLRRIPDGIQMIEKMTEEKPDGEWIKTLKNSSRIACTSNTK
jgi:hypothetical protein